MLYRLTIFLLVILLFFSGCNSGDPYLANIPQSFAVIKVEPKENQTNVDIHATIEVTFEKEVDLNTLTNKNFMLSDKRSGQSAAGKITYDKGSNKLIFSPISPLVQGRDYEITINQVKGINGEFIAPHVYNFRTANDFSVTEINPKPDSQGIPVSGALRQEILIAFSESLINNFTEETFYAYEDSVGEQFSEVLDAQITYNSALNAVSLKPRLGRLKYSKNYHVVLKDILSVNQGRIAEVSYSFSTEMAQIRSVAPANNSLNNLTTSEISILFSLPVDRNTVVGNIKVRKLYGNQQEYMFPEGPEYLEEGEGTRVSFKTLNQPLSKATRYEIFIKGVKSAHNEEFKEFKTWFETET